jgi:hypothetical protein
MSDDQFLARWSRRKQEAKAPRVEPVLESAVKAPASAPSDCAAPEPLKTELPNLPPIESINAATDITAFLRKGIPQAVSRAALRRAWSADPAIRDFVGLAENAWDFNDPNAMPGFGALDYPAEQVDALVRRIVGGLVETAESAPNLAEAAEGGARSAPAKAGCARSSNSVKAITDPRPFDEPAAGELRSSSAAPQPMTASGGAAVPRRTHGGALPQ